jgi:hypothetical protein
MLGKLWKLSALFFIVHSDIADELRELPENRKWSELKSLLLFFGIFYIVAISVVVFSIVYITTKSTVFSVTANVERVSISPFPNQPYPKWVISDATLHPDCGPEKIVVSGILSPHPSTYIDILRIQSQQLTINLENDDFNSSGTFISKDNRIIPLEDCASFTLEAQTKSYILPIEGNISIGGTLKEASEYTPILYEGEISILDKALVTREYYSVGPFVLNMGDVFEVEGLDVKSSGFIQVNSDRGINVNYNIKGDKGLIKKYKTEEIIIRNGMWTKIYNDPSLIIVWLIGVFIYAVCRLFIRINLNGILNSGP